MGAISKVSAHVAMLKLMDVYFDKKLKYLWNRSLWLALVQQDF